MSTPHRPPLALCAVLLFAAPALQAQPAPAAAAGPLAVEASFTDQAVAPGETLTLRFVQPFPFAAGRFAVMVGVEDVTAHFSLKDAQTLRGVFADAALPAGEHALKVFGISADNEWAQVAELALKVRPAAGGQWRSAIKPGAVFELRGQAWEHHSGTAPPPPRSRFVDGSVLASLATDHGNGAWGIKTDTRVVATTHQADALQYATRGGQAPKVDLARYVVEAVRESDASSASRLAFGQMAGAGEHPLLVSGVANRGVVFQQQLGERASLMLSSQSSATLLGTRNLSGMAERDDRFSFATLGYELLPRAGALRAELSGFSGSSRGAASPGSSAPPSSSSKSRGWGLRMVGATEDNRWRGELAVAQSTHTPSTMPLATIGASPAVPAAKQREAYVIGLRRELLQAYPLWDSRPDLPLGLSAALRRERTAPQYLSLGASLNADVVVDSAELAATLGPAIGGIKLQRQHDNLDADPTRTRNQAPTWGLTLALPLGPLLSAQAPQPWWPALQYAYGHHRNRADPGFIPDGSTPANLTHTLGVTHTLGLSWSIQGVTAGYNLTRTSRDDRQPSDFTTDTVNTSHTLSLAWAASETLQLGGNLGRATDRALQTGVLGITDSAGINLAWAWDPRLQLTANLSHTRTHDEPLSASLRVWTGDVLLKRSFSAQAFGLNVPGQVWVRYAFNKNVVRTVASLGGVPVRWEILTVGLGLAF